MKRALITGANGQDGVLLGHHLMAVGMRRVVGVVRGRDRALPAGVERRLMPGPEGWEGLLQELRPDEIYHLGADSFAGEPQAGAVRMLESNVMVAARLLEAVSHQVPDARVFLAGSAMAFGDPPYCPQTELTPRAASSLYGMTKAALHALAAEYRRRGIFVRVGILYNHESRLRPERFVTRKITAAAARIAAGTQQELILGNLEVIRDWGHAEDFVRAMRLMMESEVAEDRVVATGQGRTVREFCRMAFTSAGLDYTKYVRVAPEFWRPAEKVPLIGNSSWLMEETGWRMEHPFEDMVREMITADMKAAAGEAPEWTLEGDRLVLVDGDLILERPCHEADSSEYSGGTDK